MRRRRRRSRRSGSGGRAARRSRKGPRGSRDGASCPGHAWGSPHRPSVIRAGIPANRAGHPWAASTLDSAFCSAISWAHELLGTVPVGTEPRNAGHSVAEIGTVPVGLNPATLPAQSLNWFNLSWHVDASWGSPHRPSVIRAGIPANRAAHPRAASTLDSASCSAISWAQELLEAQL